MNKKRRERLMELALEATDGPWECHQNNAVTGWQVHLGPVGDRSFYKRVATWIHGVYNERYLEAVSPDEIRSLLRFADRQDESLFKIDLILIEIIDVMDEFCSEGRMQNGPAAVVAGMIGNIQRIIADVRVKEEP